MSNLSNICSQAFYFQFSADYFQNICSLLVTNDQLLFNSNYQIQYERNFSLLQNKYKNMIKRRISYQELRAFLLEPPENRK